MNTNRWLLHTLAAACAGQIVLIAQKPPAEPPPPPKPPPADYHLDLEAPVAEAQQALDQVEQQLREVGGQVQVQLAEANRAVELAHAEHARQLAQAKRAMQLAQAAVERGLVGGEPPEVPEAPEAPEPPEDALDNHLEHAIQFWNAENGDVLGFGGGVGIGGPFGGSTEPLIVPSGEAKPEVLNETREDLAILSRVLRKAAGRTDGQPEAMGIVLSSLPGLRQPQALYLGGYGALFVLNVQFPLAPAEESKAKPAEKPSNTAWEEARRELYGPQRAPDPFAIAKPGPRHALAYNADRVARLKREVVEALKNASNLRHVADDEQVVVTVTGAAGPGVSSAKVVRIEKQVRRTERSTGSRAPVVTEVRAENRSAAGSTLVFRVKKSDADAYAVGKLEPDEFARRVTITTY
jgi:hypothetical protein